MYGVSEFCLAALLMVAPLAQEWGVELLGFLLLLCGGRVIVVLQPLGSVVVAHCSRGV